MENETNNTTVANEQQETTQPEDNGTQSKKTFTQDEVNKIVSERLARERAKSEAIYTDIEARENAIADKERAFEDKEKAFLEKENRLFAIKAIKDAGLDDGGNEALEFVDLVISGKDDTEETIKTKVNTVKSFLDKRVAAEVEKIFKVNGRVPEKSGTGEPEEGDYLRGAFGLANNSNSRKKRGI